MAEQTAVTHEAFVWSDAEISSGDYKQPDSGRVGALGAELDQR